MQSNSFGLTVIANGSRLTVVYTCEVYPRGYLGNRKVNRYPRVVESLVLAVQKDMKFGSVVSGYTSLRVN